jgi:hypothetical protein
MRSGFHLGYIDGFELFNVFENLRKLALELGDLFIAQVKAGQPGCVAHIKFGSHEAERKSGSGISRKKIFYNGLGKWSSSAD